MPENLSQPISEPLLQSRKLERTFQMGDATIRVLGGVDLHVNQGEFVAIEGRSGSGKSTLLHVMGLLDKPTSGTVTFDGESLYDLPPRRRAQIRNESFGFVFQFYHLLPELNVLENTMLASMVKWSWLGFRKKSAGVREDAKKLLDTLGMSHRLTHRPSQLSGGERQRVAIARALMNKPHVLFADEPTGNLDFDTGLQIMSVLNRLHREEGQTIVMVTHDRTIAKQADRILVLDRGLIREN